MRARVCVVFLCWLFTFLTVGVERRVACVVRVACAAQRKEGHATNKKQGGCAKNQKIAKNKTQVLDDDWVEKRIMTRKQRTHPWVNGVPLPKRERFSNNGSSLAGKIRIEAETQP